MKTHIKIFFITLFCILTIVNADEKNAIMMEKIDDPFAGMTNIMGASNVAQVKSMMGDKSKATNYKHCIQNIKTKGFINLYQGMKEEASEGGEYNDIKNITLVETCPLPANGGCDHGTRIEYFYTDSRTILEDQKEGCEYFKKKWLTFDYTSGSTKDTKAPR